jgi:hypothetical protein
MSFGEFLTQTSYQPKRDNLFTVRLGNPIRLMFEAKTVKKPTLEFGSVELNSVDGTSLYYPASPSWSPVTITFMAGGVDNMFQTVETDVSRGIVEILAASGYEKFGDRQYKANAIDALGELAITQINSDGDLVEEWVLINPFIESVDFGNLDYSSDNLSEISVTFRYDHATAKYADGPTVVEAPTEFIKIT